MKISELTEKLQKVRKQRGNVEVFAMDNTYGTYGTGDFVPLEKDGIRFNKDKKLLYIGWG